MFKRHRLDLGDDYSPGKKRPSDGYVTLTLPKSAVAVFVIAAGCFVVVLLLASRANIASLAS